MMMINRKTANRKKTPVIMINRKTAHDDDQQKNRQ
jgi:hypothetical protein